ncbi:tripartite tricarboxylate transporter TctB family protein [uncultured Mailhella sp.]|uniref:tripartite tricarboxylate transporter TctB family protein n=1 Tax=uncultured Mailhella sp. TaxID=1981031 RepID=UPI0025F6949D|nr:tripartite tricarboxylate transporter TctB family protein [uncultured Mailhella sp.]
MNNDRWIGLGFIILCALMWFVIIPGQTEGAEEAFVPRLTVLGLAVPSLIMVVRRPRTVTPLNFYPDAFVHSTLPTLGLFIAYLVGVTFLGFYVSTACFLVLSLLLFGERRTKTLILAPAGLLVAVYVVVAVFLNFQLPAGLLV